MSKRGPKTSLTLASEPKFSETYYRIPKKKNSRQILLQKNLSSFNLRQKFGIFLMKNLIWCFSLNSGERNPTDFS